MIRAIMAVARDNLRSFTAWLPGLSGVECRHRGLGPRATSAARALDHGQVLARLPVACRRCDHSRMPRIGMRPLPGAFLVLTCLIAVASVPISLGREALYDTVLYSG